MKPRKLVHGVGINDADYAVANYETIGCVDGKQKQKRVWLCPYYQAWTSMLERCYSAKWHERNPTYKNCTVSDEWLTFSNFKAWMEKQDFEGKQFDKDLLVQVIRFYSAETAFLLQNQ